MLLGLYLLLTGCSVYESSGRKAFESRAPGSLVSGNIGQSFEGKSLSVGSCWRQSQSQALAPVSSQEAYLVMNDSNNPDNIEVCAVYPAENPYSDSPRSESVGR